MFMEQDQWMKSGEINKEFNLPATLQKPMDAQPMYTQGWYLTPLVGIGTSHDNTASVGDLNSVIVRRPVCVTTWGVGVNTNLFSV